MRTIPVVWCFLVLMGCHRSMSENERHSAGAYSKVILDQTLFLVNDSVLVGLNSNQLSISKKTSFRPDSQIMIQKMDNKGLNLEITYLRSDRLDVKTFLLDGDQTIYYFLDNVAFTPNSSYSIGEYKMSDDINGIPVRIWSTEVDFRPGDRLGSHKNGNLFLSRDPRRMFMEQLKHEGIFFKTSGGLYLWMLNDSIFFVRKRIKGNKKKIMFHVLTESTFINLDFHFEHKLSNKLLLTDEYEVAEIKAPTNIFLYDIRIGEYVVENSGNKNLWAQRINMGEVKTNELLKFQGDIEEIRAE